MNYLKKKKRFPINIQEMVEELDNSQKFNLPVYRPNLSDRSIRKYFPYIFRITNSTGGLAAASPTSSAEAILHHVFRPLARYTLRMGVHSGTVINHKIYTINAQHFDYWQKSLFYSRFASLFYGPVNSSSNCWPVALFSLVQ